MLYGETSCSQIPETVTLPDEFFLPHPQRPGLLAGSDMHRLGFGGNFEESGAEPPGDYEEVGQQLLVGC